MSWSGLERYDGRARTFEEHSDWAGAIESMRRFVAEQEELATIRGAAIVSRTGAVPKAKLSRARAFLNRAEDYAELVGDAIRRGAASEAAYLGVALGELLVMSHKTLALEHHAERDWARQSQLKAARKLAPAGTAKARRRKARAKHKDWLLRAGRYSRDHAHATTKDLARWVARDECGPAGYEDVKVWRPIYRVLLDARKRRAGRT